MLSRARVERERRLREISERHAARNVERAVELLDADRPSDDDWEALA